jgi:hypothetical protein
MGKVQSVCEGQITFDKGLETRGLASQVYGGSTEERRRVTRVGLVHLTRASLFSGSLQAGGRRAVGSGAVRFYTRCETRHPEAYHTTMANGSCDY